MPEQFEDKLLTLRALSVRRGPSIKSLKGLIKQGLPYYQWTGERGGPGAIRVRISDFDRFMERFRYGPDPVKIAEEMLR